MACTACDVPDLKPRAVRPLPEYRGANCKARRQSPELGAVPRPGGTGPQTEESMEANNTRLSQVHSYDGLGDTHRPRGDDAIIAIKACTSQPSWSAGASFVFRSLALKHQASKPKIEERDGSTLAETAIKRFLGRTWISHPGLSCCQACFYCIRHCIRELHRFCTYFFARHALAF